MSQKPCRTYNNRNTDKARPQNPITLKKAMIKAHRFLHVDKVRAKRGM